MWNARIYAYDVRGMGETRLPAPTHRTRPRTRAARKAFLHRGGDIAALLTGDLCRIFWDVKARERERALAANAPLPEFVLAGHSFGGWLSLFAAEACHVRRLFLFDISILPPSTAALWALACVFRKRDLHTLAVAARHRKKRYRSAEEALRVFRRTPFFRGWDRTRIRDFIDANYRLEGGSGNEPAGLVLRHDPSWEASIYEAQQPSATLAFLSTPSAIRARLEVTQVAGGASDVCDPGAGRYFRGFFPRARWIVLPDADHMFPFNREESLLSLLGALECGPDRVRSSPAGDNVESSLAAPSVSSAA
jgi:pimeloyl-ACP methyl ester carboxylesterase